MLAKRMPLHQDDQVCIQHVLASSLPWFCSPVFEACLFRSDCENGLSPAGTDQAKVGASRAPSTNGTIGGGATFAAINI